MSINIIRANKEHVELIQQLAYAIWPDTFKQILSPAQIDYMLQWMYNPSTLLKNIESGHQFWLAYEQQEPIGFIGLQVDFPQPGDLKIHKLYVLTSRQGKGLGKLLINQAVRIGVESACNRLILNVNRFNQAVSFYKHIGFQILYKEDIAIGEGYLMEDFVMGYELKP